MFTSGNDTLKMVRAKRLLCWPLAMLQHYSNAVGLSGLSSDLYTMCYSIYIPYSILTQRNLRYIHTWCTCRGPTSFPGFSMTKTLGLRLRIPCCTAQSYSTTYFTISSLFNCSTSQDNYGMDLTSLWLMFQVKSETRTYLPTQAPCKYVLAH